MLDIVTLLRDKIKNDEMLLHGSLMVIFGLAMGVFNYLYQLLMGIMLDSTQYGILYSLIAFVTIVTVVSQAIQTSITKYTSKFQAQKMFGAASYLWHISLKWTILAGVAAFLILAALTPLISQFLKIDNYWYAVILFSSLIFAFALPVNYGMLQGLQRFIPLGFSGTLSTFLKLVMAVLLVYLGYGLYGGLIPHLLSSVIIFFVTMYFLRDIARSSKEKYKLDGLYQYGGLALLAVASFIVLTNIDAILVKHYLSPESMGNYAAISVLGKVALFLPGGIVVAMFPKTSSLFEAGGGHRQIMMRAVIFTILLSGAVIAVYWLFSDVLINFLFQGKYSPAAPYLFKYAIAMAFYALSFLMMNYFLSLNATRVAYSLLASVVLQLVLIFFFHGSIAQIINVILISGIASVVLILPFYVFKVKR